MWPAPRCRFQYREYALGSSLAAVIKTSGTHVQAAYWGVYLGLPVAPLTLRERLASIQELEWRAPYVRAGRVGADPVLDVLFSFYDDRLYQVVVTYDQNRTEGLTNGDMTESISATYGVPLLEPATSAHRALSADVPEQATVVAQWEHPSSLLTLTRDTDAPRFQLILIAKTLNRTRAP